MTESDWATCESPFPMLIFLRGPVREEERTPPSLHCYHGDLYWGPGTGISPEQCRLFILQSSRRLYDLELDVPSRNALDAYHRYVLEGSPWQDFGDACQRIQKVLDAGGSAIVSHMAAIWGDNPLGAATAASDIAGSIADFKAKDSVAVTCANFTDDDWSNYWGGPPDPLWQATRAAEEKFQADVLREIVGRHYDKA